MGKPVTLPLFLGHPVTTFEHYYIDSKINTLKPIPCQDTLKIKKHLKHKK